MLPWFIKWLYVAHQVMTTASQSVFPEIGYVNTSLPGFSEVFEHPGWTDPTDRYSLLLSTFSAVPFTRDSSYIYLNIGKYLNDLTEFLPTLLYDDFSWPREPKQTPLGVFGFDTITQPDGFLPPGKNNGTIFVQDVRDFDNVLTYDIVRDPADPDPRVWFYHRAVWRDFNLDGRQDALTCRVRIFGDPPVEETEMLWLEQPPSEPLGQVWTQHLINQNICGTFQEGITLDIPGEGPIYAVFTVGYFTGLLAVHWSTEPNGSWANVSNIQTRIIDTGHQFFDFDIVDANKDGRLDILMTWNAEVNGSFVVYEIPDDFRTGPYPLHVLVEGFTARSGSMGGGTPGTGQAFYPTTNQSLKPWIVLSGDDDGRTYYLTPRSEDPLDWNYDLGLIRDAGPNNIMGRPSVMDADGDGLKEIYVPVYYQNVVYIHEYSP